ncbi:SpaA isopeptide-forming pilin-related protein [Enterococcus sp.]|uniref:SpaA isopeptide-forming pilin-related protein n=1 Tax=Enterococcus sp. TaxID=35783 RepID=UPI002FCB2B47
MKRKLQRLGKFLFAGMLILPIILPVIFSSSALAAEQKLTLAFKPQPTKVADQGELVITTINPSEVIVTVTPDQGLRLTKTKTQAGKTTYQYKVEDVGKYAITATQIGTNQKETTVVTINQTGTTNTAMTADSKSAAAIDSNATNDESSSMQNQTTVSSATETTNQSKATLQAKATQANADNKAVKGAVVRELPTADEDKLGNLWDYNAYLTGQHSANMADTEGAIAVKGDSVFPNDLQTFTYGASFREVNTTIGDPIREDQYVNVLIGGKIANRAQNDWVKPVVENRTSNGKTQGWLVGRMNMNDWIYKNLGEWFSAIAYKTRDSVIDGAFDSLQTQENQLTGKLDQVTTNLGETVYEGDNFKLIASKSDAEVLILKPISIQDPLELKTLSIPAEYLQGNRYKQIIVNSPATKVVMNGTSIAGAVQQDVGTYSQLASKVTFYLPHAQSITNYVEDDGAYPDTAQLGIAEDGSDNYGKDNGKNYYHSFTIGSIVAPNATVVYHSGSINGYVFVKNLHQRDGMEIHNFYNPWMPEIEQEKEGEVQLHKEDATDKSALAGAEFGIRKKGDSDFIAVKTTDETGNLTFSGLAYGEYEILETKAPNGYQLSPMVHEVTINEDKPTLSLTLENQKEPVAHVGIEIHKEDAENQEELAGAVFGLRGLREHEFTKEETNAAGNAEFEDLVPGYYELVELTSPEGYEIDPHPQIIYVDGQNKKEVIEIENTAKEEKTGSIQLKKIDAATGDALAGVEFGVREFGHRDFVTKKTDSNGVVQFSDLKAGAFYTVAELKTLTGYELTPRPLVVKVSEKGQDVNIGNWTNHKEVLKKGSLQIEKSDQETGSPLKGAIFGVRALGQKDYIEKETDKSGIVRFDDLAQGVYEVRELKAPLGYSTTNLVKKVNVGYDEENKLTIEKWTNVKTAVQLGSGKIIKVDENGSPLSGAEFAIRNDHEREFSQHAVTNEQGEAYFDNLPFGKYDVMETKAPDGYQPDGKIYHLYVGNKETDEETITVTNQKKVTNTGQVALEKREQDSGKVMTGVVFNLEKSDGTILDMYTTDKNGRIFVKDLPLGNYQFVEQKTLPGYELDPTPLTFTITHDNETQVFLLNMVNVKENPTESTTDTTSTTDTESTTESTTGTTDTVTTSESTAVRVGTTTNSTKTANATKDNHYPKTGDRPNWYLMIGGTGLIAGVIYLFYRKNK